jgi:hypothetical protein
VLIGIVVAGRTYEGHDMLSSAPIRASDYGYAVLLWVALLVGVRILGLADFVESGISAEDSELRLRNGR